MKAGIRTRLTLRYTCVFVALLGIYVAVVFGFEYLQLLDQMYRDEVQQVEAVEGLLTWGPDGKLRLHDEYYSHPQSRLLVNQMMEVHDANGDVLYRSNSLGGHELGPLSYPHEGDKWFERYYATLSDGRDVLLTSHKHPVDGRMVLIRLGYDLGPMRDRMLHFMYLLLLALPPSVLLAAWAGHRLTQKAFAPLKELTERAERITVRDLGQRLQVPEPGGDELGRIATVLNDLLSRLEQSFTQLQRFTADVAHELRTPLAALRLSGEEALMSARQADYPAVIGTMLEESERLIDTVNGLLLLASTEASSSQRTRSIFSMKNITQEILGILDVLLEERALQIEINGEENNVYGDKTLTQSALLNILHNAIRYAPAGSTIHLRYSRAQHEGTEMQQMCIEDNGPGLQPGEHARIFNRFYRGANQVEGPSAGLGLSIAKMAIEHSGGYIYADESYTLGLRCCVALPLSN